MSKPEYDDTKYWIIALVSLGYLIAMAAFLGVLVLL